MPSVGHIITNTSLVVVLDGITYSATTSQPNFEELKSLIREKKWEEFKQQVNIGNYIKVKSYGNFTVKGDSLYYKEERVCEVMERRILDAIENKYSVNYLLNFYENAKENPDQRSIDELYMFLQHKNIPIDDDGYILAYKSIRSNWTDWHTGTVTNKIGQTPTMPRDYVNDDRYIGCSKGYHAGSLEYAQSFGGNDKIIVIVKINPKDVVSVPIDCSFQKMRVCSYEVVDVYKEPLPNNYLKVKQALNEETVKARTEIKKELIKELDTLQNKFDTLIEENAPQCEIIEIFNAMQDISEQLDTLE